MKAARLELSCWSKIGFPAVPVLAAAPPRPTGWLIRNPWSEKKFAAVAGVAGKESRMPEIEGAANSEKFAVAVIRDPPFP